MAIKKGINIFVLMLLLIFSLNFASSISNPSSWSNYGGELQYVRQSQFFNSYSNFDSNPYTFIQTFGSGGDSKPLVTDLFNGNFPRFIVQTSGNYITITDSSGNLINQEFTIGHGSMLSTGDFTGFGLRNQIAGIFNDSGQVIIKYYIYNYTTNNLSLLKYINLTEISGNTNLGHVGSNFRCQSGNENTSFCVFRVTTGSAYGSAEVKLYYNESYVASGCLIDSICAEFATIDTDSPSWTDINNDGSLEFLQMLNVNGVKVYDNDMNLILTIPDGGGDVYTDAKFSYPDLSGTGKIYVARKNGAFLSIFAHRLDGSVAWSDTTNIVGDTSDSIIGIGVAEFGNSSQNEQIYVAYNEGEFYNKLLFKVFRGSDGASLYSVESPVLNVTDINFTGKLTIARMGGDQTHDFIVTVGNGERILVWDTDTNSFIVNYFANDSSVIECVPSDINFDTLTDIACSSLTDTYLFLSNGTNQNAYITSVSYSPATTVHVGSSVTATVSCTDPQSFPILYSSECDTGSGFSSESTNNNQQCLYNLIGTYNMTVRCRNIYISGQWDTYSQLINAVNPTPQCNFNGICEVGFGENYLTCSADCNADNSSTNPTQDNPFNDLTIPTDLVDTSSPDSTSGLLPEIYMGIISFLSHSLSPLILLVFIIFFTLTLLAIGTIIRKIFIKITN